MAGEKVEAQYKELDGQIESLMKCTPLPEAEVKVLCDKAREILQVRSFMSPFLLKGFVLPLSPQIQLSNFKKDGLPLKAPSQGQRRATLSILLFTPIMAPSASDEWHHILSLHSFLESQAPFSCACPDLVKSIKLHHPFKNRVVKALLKIIGIAGRVQCAARELPGDCVRRHPRPIPGPSRAVSDRRELPGHQLPVHGGLCGQRLPLRGDSQPAGGPESAIQRPDYHPEGQPRVASNHTSVRPYSAAF